MSARAHLVLRLLGIAAIVLAHFLPRAIHRTGPLPAQIAGQMTQQNAQNMRLSQVVSVPPDSRAEVLAEGPK